MSLDWDTTKCAEPLPQNDEERHLRTNLVWATMSVDLGSITEKNLEEWVFRLWFQKDTLRHVVIDDEVTPEVIRGWLRRWIGLSTNVLNLSRQKWLARVTKILEERAVRELRAHEPAEAE